MMTLTDRQQQVFDAIVAFMRAERVPPTVRELGAKVGISSPNGIAGHLQALVRKGYITKGRASRSIRLVNSRECPCCGGKQA